jgi:hypothetical protein
MYARGIQVTGGWIIHHAGIPWYDHPMPWRWHFCVAVTSARLGIVVPEFYQRCACGGWRVRHFGADGFTAWRERNCRRAGKAYSLTVL